MCYIFTVHAYTCTLGKESSQIHVAIAIQLSWMIELRQVQIVFAKVEIKILGS